MKKSYVVTAVAAALFTIHAGAETTPGNTTTTTAPSSIREKISAALDSYYHGPSLGNLDSSLQPDENGALSGDAQFFENTLSAGYKLNDLTKLGVAANFNYQPVRGQEFTLANPYIKVSRSKIVEKNGMVLNGSARAYLPVTSASRAKHFAGALRVDPSLGFQPSGSRWSTGLEGMLRTKFFGGNVTYTTLEMAATPHVDYQLNEKTGFSFSTDLCATLEKEAMKVDPSNFVAGASFQVRPNLNLSPSLQFRPTSKIGLDSTQFNLSISANLL